MIYDLISALIFYSLIGIFLYKNRKKVSVEYKIFFLLKTRKVLGIIEKTGNKFKKIIKVYSTIAMIAGFPFVFLSISILLQNAFKLIIKPESASKMSIMIPGVPTGGAVYLPLWFGMISIGIAAFIHEFSHGIAGISEGVKPKSTGIGFLLVQPLAFVEFDDKSLLSAKKISRLRILSAGPMANISMAIILSIFVSLIFYPAIMQNFNYDGIKLIGVEPGSPSYDAGLRQNIILTYVNGIQVSNMTHFVSLLENIAPESEVILSSASNHYSVKTIENPNNESSAYLGIFFEQNWKAKNEGILYNALLWLFNLLGWMIQINFMLGIWNFLPILFADGGRFLYDYASYFIKDEKKTMKIVNFANSFVIFLLILNLFGSYIF